MFLDNTTIFEPRRHDDARDRVRDIRAARFHDRSMSGRDDEAE